MEDRDATVDRLFEEAVALPNAEQAAYLDRACAHMPGEYRDEVESLLRAERRLANRQRRFLERSADITESLGDALQEDPMVGAYCIRKRVGSGGFGNVYAAVRTGEFEQQVAIKLIRRDHYDRQMILRRFELERQVLSDLNHPHIARLLDGGSTDDGRPYFVMELVDGKPITDHCADQRMSVNRRVKLIQSVCFAVAHAHQYGIIHRDIKPDNILITDAGIPKLVDFGIAKLVDQGAAERGMALTETGHLPMTPQYASPEQIRHEPVGTASDVYSLGLVLYELLTGQRPFDTQSDLRSTGSSTNESPLRRPSVAVQTDTERSRIRYGPDAEPQALSKMLRGDLDNILLKALRAEPEQRYPSAVEMADDIQRYFDGHPVTAAKGSLQYRIGKFARRNRLAAISAAAMALVVFASAISILAAWHRSAVLSQELRRNLYESETKLAYSAWNDGNVERVGQLLRQQIPDSGQQDLREFPWYYLASLYQQNDIAFQQLPRPVATSIYDGNVSVYLQYQEDAHVVRLDVTTGDTTHVADFTGELLAISEHGAKLVVCPQGTPNDTDMADVNGTERTFAVAIQDVSTETSVTLPLPFQPDSGAISADESLVAAVAHDGSIRVWNAETMRVLLDEGAVVRPDDVKPSQFGGATFSGDNTWVAIHCDGGNGAIIWHIASRRSRRFDIGQVFSLCFSPRASKLAIAGQRLHLLDLSGADAPLRAFEENRVSVLGNVDFSADGDFLLTRSDENTIRVWHTTSARMVAELKAGYHYAQRINFDDSGRRLVGVTKQEYFVWDFLDTGDSIFTEANLDWTGALATYGPPLSVGFGGLRERLIVWSPGTDRVESIAVEGSSEDAYQGASAVAFSGDGHLVAAGDGDGNIVVWDRSARRQVHSFNRTSAEEQANAGEESELEENRQIASLAFSADARQLVSSDRIRMTAWNLVSGEPLWSVPSDGWITGIVPHSDKVIVVGAVPYESGFLRVWDVTQDQPRLELEWPHDRMIVGMSLSPDGRFLATFDGDPSYVGKNALNLYDLAALEKGPRRVAESSAIIKTVTFSDDGRTLVDWGYDGHMTMWNVMNGREVARLKVRGIHQAIDVVKLDNDSIGVVSAATFGHYSDFVAQDTDCVRVHWINRKAIDRFWVSHRLK